MAKRKSKAHPGFLAASRAKSAARREQIKAEHWRAIALVLAQHVRNVDAISPHSWGVQGGELLMRVRELDPKGYAENVRLYKEPGEKADTISVENVQKMWVRMAEAAWEEYRLSGCTCEVNSVGGYPNILRYSTACPLPAHAKVATAMPAPEENVETEEEAKERVRKEQEATPNEADGLATPPTSGHWG